MSYFEFLAISRLGLSIRYFARRKEKFALRFCAENGRTLHQKWRTLRPFCAETDEFCEVSEVVSDGFKRFRTKISPRHTCDFLVASFFTFQLVSRLFSSRLFIPSLFFHRVFSLRRFFSSLLFILSPFLLRLCFASPNFVSFCFGPKNRQLCFDFASQSMDGARRTTAKIKNSPRP